MPENTILPDSGSPEVPYRKCDGRGQFCPTLDSRLSDHHSKGLVFMDIMNFRTGKRCEPIVAHKTSARDKGLMLNFCPWCGKPLNRKYQPAEPPAPVVHDLDAEIPAAPEATNG